MRFFPPAGEICDSLTWWLAQSDTADGELATAERAVSGEIASFKEMNVAIAARLDSEVPDTDLLQKRVDQLYLKQTGEDAIERRTELTIVIWKEVNAARAAEAPPRLALTVRSTTVAQYDTRYQALTPKKGTRDVKDGVVHAKRSAELTAARTLDRWNKSWHQAWKSEFPAGTEKGDALAMVHTEESTPPPQVLLITAVVQQGLSLKATYDPASGAHATVLELLYKVTGVDTDYRRVRVNRELGNTIGPFLENQVVTLRTDVGNSRDFSEQSPEQSVTIGPAV